VKFSYKESISTYYAKKIIFLFLFVGLIQIVIGLVAKFIKIDIFNQVIIPLALAGCIIWLWNKAQREFSINLIKSFKMHTKTILSFTGLLMTMNIIITKFGNSHQTAPNFFDSIPLISIFLLGIILGPLYEEIIFREIMIRRLFSDRLLGTIFSILLFTFLHQIDSWQAFFVYFLSTLLFTTEYLITKDVGATIITHALLNFSSFLFFFF
jgi:membrane protease YdiL (CAAX protease family)